MASSQDKLSRQYGNDESQISFNQGIAESQREKTAYRAQTVSASADKFNPQRIASYPKPIDN